MLPVWEVKDFLFLFAVLYAVCSAVSHPVFKCSRPLWKVYTLSVAGDRLIVGTAGRRVLVWDLRNMGYVQQRRESSLKYQTRCIRAFPNKQVRFVMKDVVCRLNLVDGLGDWLSAGHCVSLTDDCGVFFFFFWQRSGGNLIVSSPAPGLRLEFNRRPRRCGVPGPEPGSSEEEVRLQVPPTEGGGNRTRLPGQRHLLPQYPQHLCHRYNFAASILLRF